MMQRLRWAVLLTLLLANQALAEGDLTKLIKMVQPAVVTIITYDKNNMALGQGSGFFIDKKGHLITNYHVLKGAFSADVNTHDGNKYPIKLIVGEDENADIIKAQVDIPEVSVHFLKITKTTPAVGEHILVVGSPKGLEYTISEGIISGIREFPNKGQVFQISAPIGTVNLIV